MRKGLVIFLILNCLDGFCKNNVDSLKIEFNKQGSFELCGKIAWSFINTNPDSYYHYVKKEKEIANKNKNILQRAIAVADLANFYFISGKYDSAIYCSEIALPVLYKSKNLKLYIENDLNYIQTLSFLNKNKAALDSLKSIEFLSNSIKDVNLKYSLLKRIYLFQIRVCYSIGLYEESLKIAFKNDSLLILLKDEELLYKNQNEIGNIYSIIGNKNKALEFHQKSFENCIKAKDSINFLHGFNNLLNSYLSLDSLKLASSIICKANLFLKENPTIINGTLDFYYNQNEYFLKVKKYDSCIFYLQKAEAFAKLNNDEFSLNQIEVNKANLYIILCNYDKAIVLLKKSLPLFINSGDIEACKDVNLKLANCYFKQGNTALAYKCLTETNRWKDSILNSEKQNSIIAQEIKYETSIKEAQITQQASELSIIKKKNTFILLSSLLAGLSAIFGFLFFRNKQQQKQTESDKQKLVYQLSSIKSKVIPHFSGNILNAITYFFEIGESKKGIEYLSRYTELNKQILIGSDKPSASLESEITFLKNYIELEQLRFGEDLKFNLNIDATVDRNLQVPVLILHTFCENAIKHGIMSQKGNGTVDVNITIENIDTILINIKDDGIGREAASKLNLESTGQGLSILTKQIELYNENNSNKIKLNIEDIINNGVVAGTNVIVSIPVNYNYN